jgi:uroporphyrinogen decarboxylase
MLTALSLAVPDKVPNGFEGFNRQALETFKEKTGTEDYLEYFNVDYRVPKPNPPKEPVRDPMRIYKRYHKNLPPSASITDWGRGRIQGSDAAFDHFIAPLKEAESLQEIEEYPLLDLFEDYHWDGLKQNTEKLKKENFATTGWMEKTIFETAWGIRGFNELMMDFVLNEKLASCLVDRITELRCYQAKKFAEAGVDIIQFGDDIGMQDQMMMSLDTWRKWLKPRLKQIIQSCLDVKPDTFIFYHSDGFIEPMIPELIEIGVNVLNPVQPECMDPEKLKKEYGDKLAFWGTIGTQTTMPFGSPEDVKNAVRKRIETVGKGGGLVLSPTHVIEPDVPWENLVAFFEALEEYGKY